MEEHEQVGFKEDEVHKICGEVSHRQLDDALLQSAVGTQILEQTPIRGLAVKSKHGQRNDQCAVNDANA